MRQPKPTLISTICGDIDTYQGIERETPWYKVKEIMNQHENAISFQQHWNARLYNNLKLAFSRFMKNADVILRGASASAYKIIFILGLNALQSNYIAISLEDLAGISLISKPTVSKTITELENRGALITRVKGTKGNPSLYYINPMICTCCKISLEESMKRDFLAKLKKKDESIYNNLLKTINDTEPEYIQDPTHLKESIPYVLIRKRTALDNSTKKRASADQNTDSTEPHTGSEPQDNSNPPQQKNQDSYTDNMQNLEEILSEFEEEMFSGKLSDT